MLKIKNFKASPEAIGLFLFVVACVIGIVLYFKWSSFKSKIGFLPNAKTDTGEPNNSTQNQNNVVSTSAGTGQVDDFPFPPPISPPVSTPIQFVTDLPPRTPTTVVQPPPRVFYGVIDSSNNSYSE